VSNLIVIRFLQKFRLKSRLFFSSGQGSSAMVPGQKFWNCSTFDSHPKRSLFVALGRCSCFCPKLRARLHARAASLSVISQFFSLRL
jgi:hypothetical protein